MSYTEAESDQAPGDGPYIVVNDGDAPPRSSRTAYMDAALTRARKQNPQKTIDEFWSNFTTKQPGQAVSVLPDNLYAKRAAARAPKGIVPGHNAVASFDDAVAICRDKVAKISHACRRVNQKYRDVHFDIEWDLKGGDQFCIDGLVDSMRLEGIGLPGSVKRIEDLFENPRFYIDGAAAGDVKQGRDGDCWFLAGLCTLSNMDGLISKICVAQDETVGVYGFVFHRDGEWISTIIDDKLYLIKPDYDEFSSERFRWDHLDRVDAEDEYRKTLQTGSRALYFAQCSDQNETWLPLLEKAYAKAHGDFASIEGGFVGEAIEDLTGGVTTELFTTDILDKDKFWREELLQVNKDFLFGCFTGLFGGTGERKGIQEMHAYSVMKAVETAGEKLVLLRNPWGKTEWNGPWSDGSKAWNSFWLERLNHQFGDDGAFWISYRDLIRKFQHFDRTRLFGSEWTVTQQWTSLNVPWSVDYHETKFSVELKQAGPVVIVLSQLDDRYFEGLQGQYRFELQFRVHKEGERQYIVRSNGHYCMRRSVSTEIELKPGRYSVLLKITATRDKKWMRPEEVIRKTCVEKREKLLQIGLSYDLAHAKGQRVETEEEKKKREAREEKKKAHLKKKQVESLKAARKEAKEKEKKLRQKQKKKNKKLAEKQRKRAAKDAAKAKKGRSTEPNSEKKEGKNADEAVAQKKAELETTEKHAENDAGEGAVLVANEADVTKDGGTTCAQTGTTGAPTPASSAPGDPPPNDGAENAENETTSEDSDSDSETDLSDSDFLDTFTRDREPPPPSPLPPSRRGPPPDGRGEMEDEFAKDPWNAVCTVGLRVFSKDKDVSVQVVHPNEEEDEGALDLDDTAADAAPDGHVLTQ